MLPGKRDFYRCCKARRSTSHVNKEFLQQFQNYAPPSLRVIRTKFACTKFGRTIYIFIARYRGNSARCYELYILYSLVCVIEKCISGENVDIVVSNVPRKYAILAGYKIVMSQRSVCTRFINPCHSGFALFSRDL